MHTTSKDAGASSVEYALMLAGVAALIVLVVFAFGGMVKNLNHDNCTTINGVVSANTGVSTDCGT